MKTKQIILSVLALGSLNSYAQLNIDAEFRPRTEYRHGFKKLIQDEQDAAFFTSQRSRLNVGYKTAQYDFYMSLQDVRVWGDAGQLAENGNSFAIHQIWSKIKLTDGLALKAGRQEIAYDDHRIFGNVGWAQQARSHDALLLKYKKDELKVDFGLAFNQDKAGLTSTAYTNPKNYKTIQYVWANKKWDNMSTSLLVLNNGLQNISEEGDIGDVYFSQTIGTHIKYGLKDNLKLIANLYIQTGKDRSDRDITAHLIGLEANYAKKESKLSYGLGFELQSGRAYDADPTENNSFNPFYGTNHKFNGLMDYFYVGNHLNTVGLMDLYAKVGMKLKDKSKITAMVHQFSTPEDISQESDNQLGTEIDLVYAHKLSSDITIKAGYSHLIVGDGMRDLGGITDENYDNTNNWAWMMLVVKPKLFSGK